MGFAQSDHFERISVQQLQQTKLVNKQPWDILKITFKIPWNNPKIFNFLYYISIIELFTFQQLGTFKLLQAVHHILKTFHFCLKPWFNQYIIKRNNIFKYIICSGSIESQDYPAYPFFDRGSWSIRFSAVYYSTYS